MQGIPGLLPRVRKLGGRVHDHRHRHAGGLLQRARALITTHCAHMAPCVCSRNAHRMSCASGFLLRFPAQSRGFSLHRYSTWTNTSSCMRRWRCGHLPIPVHVSETSISCKGAAGLSVVPSLSVSVSRQRLCCMLTMPSKITGHARAAGMELGAHCGVFSGHWLLGQCEG